MNLKYEFSVVYLFFNINMIYMKYVVKCLFGICIYLFICFNDVFILY